jgi:imidazoleglycerol-phosphate dehydratase
MNARSAAIHRKTAETDISIILSLDGSGRCDLDCPIGFFGHMLASFCKHGLFDLSGTLKGDLEVDQHHLVEDTGIVLGQAFAEALGNCAGIYRAGSCLYPMDESLCRAAVDFGGRSFLVCNPELSGIPLVSAGTDGAEYSFQTDTFDDFWLGFTSTAHCNLHLDTIRGRSDHHKMEGLFKAAARAIRDAITIDERRNGAIPSTKGIII